MQSAIVVQGRDEDAYSVTGFCEEGLDIIAHFSNLGELGKHIHPRYPHMIKSYEDHASMQPYDERIRYSYRSCQHLARRLLQPLER